MRLVIIGAGFAGMYAALSSARLRDIQGVLPERLEIALVAPEPTLVVRPRLYEPKPESLTAPLSDLFKAIDMVYVQGFAEAVDTASRAVQVTTAQGTRTTLPYDRLVVASGALPPGFPAVEIDGEYYRDGGIVSNMPLSRVLSSEKRCDTLIFQVDLWPARGRLPSDLPGVASRQKDIQYSSRTRAITSHMVQMQTMRRALQRLLAKPPDNERDHEGVRAITELACHHACNTVHLIYRSKDFERHSKDYEFGLDAMREHWQSGLDDMRRTLADPRRLDRPPPEMGIVTHDVHRQKH